MPLPKTLRITGGSLVRRRFLIPPFLEDGIVRPATDRVRESLFSILKEELDGALVLDIFAGSGAYGFESISRGASHVTFIEKNKAIAENLKKSAHLLGISEKCSILLRDAYDFIAQPCSTPMDIIFLDPPFALDLPTTFFQKLKNFLKPGGLLIFRIHKKNTPLLPSDFEVVREKIYGSSKVFFICLKNEDKHDERSSFKS